MSNIRRLKRSEINDQQWDELVAGSFNSLPYAYSWYLDAVAENWEALVVGEYEVVMPLVWLRKLGVRCVYQPYYCQQLGFFSRNKVSKQVAGEMMDIVRSRFRYADMNLNPAAEVISKEWKLAPKRNLLLQLSKPYTEIRKGYSENHRRNIAKATKAGLVFTTDMELKAFQEFYLAHVDRKKENFKEKHARIFQMFTKELVFRNKGKIFAVIDTDGEVLAGVIAILHQNRVITVINSSSVEGKKTGAAHYLFDHIVQKYAATGQHLDFEGSSVASIARFYEGFGAEEELFFNYKRSFLKG